MVVTSTCNVSHAHLMILVTVYYTCKGVCVFVDVYPFNQYYNQCSPVNSLRRNFRMSFFRNVSRTKFPPPYFGYIVNAPRDVRQVNFVDKLAAGLYVSEIVTSVTMELPMPCLFCVMYKVSGRYIDCKYYYLVFRAVRTLRWRHLEFAPGVLNRWRHTHPILIITYMPMLFYVKQLLTNRKIVQTAWMTKINYIPASHDQVQPTKLAIRLFFTRILVVVCSGLRWAGINDGQTMDNSWINGKTPRVVSLPSLVSAVRIAQNWYLADSLLIVLGCLSYNINS